MLIDAKGKKTIQPLNLISLFLTLAPCFLFFYSSAFNSLYCIVLTIRPYCVIYWPLPPPTLCLVSFIPPPEGLSHSGQNHGAIYIPQCFLRLPFSLLSSEGRILCSLWYLISDTCTGVCHILILFFFCVSSHCSTNQFRNEMGDGGQGAHKHVLLHYNLWVIHLSVQVSIPPLPSAPRSLLLVLVIHHFAWYLVKPCFLPQT